MSHKEKLSKKQREIRKDDRFKRRIDIKRVEILCDSLKDGTSKIEIERKLNSLPQIRPDKIEVDSLNKVKKAIRNYSFINQIIATSSHGYEDTRLKYDLIAFLDGANIDSVGIQVKSSQKEVIRFLNKINPHYPSKSNQDILNKRKLIVINGQRPEPDIQKSFLNQFFAINNFYSTRGPH